MISGANEKQLDIANDRADLLLEIEKQKQTIQYLSECINEKDGLISSYRKEQNRLNNIINELEKYLESNFWNDDEGNESYQIEKYTTYYSVYNKLKELKESDNNE